MTLVLQGLIVFLATYGLLVLIAGLNQSLQAWRRGRRPPFVSVLLIVRDQEATIEGIVLDLLSIDYLSEKGMPNLELVVVDDRSSDSTPAILDRLAQHHSAMRVVRLTSSAAPGQSAVEVGMFLCRSPVVLLFDAHAPIESERLLEAMEYLLGARKRPDGQARLGSA